MVNLANGRVWRLRLRSLTLLRRLQSTHQAKTNSHLHVNDHDSKSRHDSIIDGLLRNPVIFNPIRSPRNPIVLCHGLYGFDVWTPPGIPKLQLHYWADLMAILRNVIGADVIVTGVPGTGSVKERAESMHSQLKDVVKGKDINFLAHSMGGLDCRHLITHIKPNEYKPKSLTTISTPHRGSPFMDWCAANIGIGAQAIQDTADASSNLTPNVPFMPFSLKSPLLQASPTPNKSNNITNNPDEKENSSSLTSNLPQISLPLAFTSSLSSYLLALLDSPAYANLTTAFTNGIFNPRTPDIEDVKYYSIAARHPGLGWWHPLYLPQLVLTASAKASLREAEGEIGDNYEGNDGLVSVSSAKWGEFLGIIDGVDHWWMRGSRGLSKESQKLPSNKSNINNNNNNNTITDAITNDKIKVNDHDKSWQDVNRQIQNNRRMAFLENDQNDQNSSSVQSIAKWFSDRIPISSNQQQSQQQTNEINQQNYIDDQSKRDINSSSKIDREKFYIALCHKLYQDGL